MSSVCNECIDHKSSFSFIHIFIANLILSIASYIGNGSEFFGTLATEDICYYILDGMDWTQITVYR